ncbi:MAG: glutathione ABC transporter substrate-binding protein [Fusobacteriaceae bacterium]|jgi:peptide/nickel transport system substrate-binding protein|nr:glutathione ABC transporter substrate-binding protein [Fusobacteriaceae bacterium]
MRKKLKMIILFMLTMVLFLSCGKKDNQIQPEKNTITIAQGADAKSLDPHATNDQPSSRVICQLYDRLVEQDNNMNISPYLAESFEQPDELTTIFKLRKGVKFHNGEELKASDVKFSLERMKASPQVNHIIEAVSEIEIVDDYTVVIRTEKPFGALLNHLSHTAASVLNEKYVMEAGESYNQKPIGTGAYKFVSWQSGDKIIFEANEQYFLSAPKVKNLIIKNIPENATRAIALETGEIDIAYDIDIVDKERIRNNEKLVLLESSSFSMTYIGFNCNKTPLDNIKLRQAICYAIDIAPILDVVWKGSASKANSLIGPNIFGYNKDAKIWNKDIEKAKELLKEAGYPDGIKVKIWLNDNQARKDIAVIIQDQIKEIGVDLALEMVEWGAFLDQTSRGDHEMYILGWSTVTGDADYGLYPLLHTSSHGGSGNRSFYSNSEVDDLLDRAKHSIDQEERKKFYARVQEIAQEEVPTLPIAYSNMSVGLQKNIEGFILNFAGHHKIFGTSFKKE